MASKNRTPSRRALLAGGLGLGSGLLTAAPSGAGKITSSEYWAKKGSVSLYMFRERMESA